MNLLKKLLAKLFKNMVALIGYGIVFGVLIFLFAPKKMWDDNPVNHPAPVTVTVKPISIPPVK